MWVDEGAVTSDAILARSNGADLTELNDDFRRNPHAQLERLRAGCPVYRDDAFGHFILTRHRDVRSVLNDPAHGRDPSKAAPEAAFIRALASRGEVGGSGILLQDDPDHRRVRGFIVKALTRRIALARPVVENVVARRIAALPDGAPFDVLHDFAIAITIESIAAILGVEPGDLPQFRKWSEAVHKLFHPARTRRETVEMATAARALIAFLQAAIAERKAMPRDDLLGDLVQWQRDGAELSDAEIVYNCRSLLAAGNLSTADLITNGVWLLLTHPVERAKLARDRGLIDGAIEEMLRYEPPIAMTTRIAARDIEVGGCPIAHAQGIQVSLMAANRDPELLPEPDRFDISRPSVPHVSFGGGSHFCAGAALARLEAKLAIAGLLERFPKLRLADGAPSPQWRRLPYSHGFDVLLVSTD